jgi:type IV pilus assembly protein PilM
MALFSRRRSSIGLDIGSSHVKLMELSQDAKSGQWSLVNFGLTRLPPEAIVDGAVMNTTVIVDAIRELVQKHRVRTKDVVCSVSGHSVIIKRVNLPLMTTEELEESIPVGSRAVHPVRHQRRQHRRAGARGSHDPGQMEVLLVAARKELVNEYQTLISDAGLRPMVVDVDAFAVANMFELNYELPSDSVALVNVGASNVNIHVLRDGSSAFTRDIGWVAGSSPEEIQRTLNISYEEAEAMKVGGEERDTEAVVPGRGDPRDEPRRRQPRHRDPSLARLLPLDVFGRGALAHLPLGRRARTPGPRARRSRSTRTCRARSSTRSGTSASTSGT